jgi:hypothetical protein
VIQGYADQNEFVLGKSDELTEPVTSEYKNHRQFEASTNVTFHYLVTEVTFRNIDS